MELNHDYAAHSSSVAIERGTQVLPRGLLSGPRLEIDTYVAPQATMAELLKDCESIFHGFDRANAHSIVPT